MQKRAPSEVKENRGWTCCNPAISYNIATVCSYANNEEAVVFVVVIPLFSFLTLLSKHDLHSPRNIVECGLFLTSRKA